jgi:DNA-binding NarL/FixJ family response regulator
VERLRKTSVYLREEEAIALRRVSQMARRSQSELLRQAVRLLACAGWEGKLYDDRPIPWEFWGWAPHPVEPRHEALSNQEDVVLAYFKTGCLPHEIAEQLRVPESEVVEALNEARRKVGPLSWGTDDP